MVFSCDFLLAALVDRTRPAAAWAVRREGTARRFWLPTADDDAGAARRAPQGHPGKAVPGRIFPRQWLHLVPRGDRDRLLRCAAQARLVGREQGVVPRRKILFAARGL